MAKQCTTFRLLPFLLPFTPLSNPFAVGEDKVEKGYNKNPPITHTKTITAVHKKKGCFLSLFILFLSVLVNAKTCCCK